MSDLGRLTADAALSNHREAMRRIKVREAREVLRKAGFKESAHDGLPPEHAPPAAVTDRELLTRLYERDRARFVALVRDIIDG
jgi:hypothetical protein